MVITADFIAMIEKHIAVLEVRHLVAEDEVRVAEAKQREIAQLLCSHHELLRVAKELSRGSLE